MTLDKFLCWISMCWTFLYGPGYWSSTNSHPFSATNSFEVQLLCLAPPPSWLQELQHQPVTCELGLPRHWSYRHGRWRRIDGCQDIMLSYTTINYYLLFIGIFSATTTATMIVIISIYFLFLFSFLLFLSLFPFFLFHHFSDCHCQHQHSHHLHSQILFRWFSVWTKHGLTIICDSWSVHATQLQHTKASTTSSGSSMVEADAGRCIPRQETQGLGHQEMVI